MAQTGYTPILIYSSSTASNAPAVGNLTNSTLGSELAINITDGKLFYKDNANVIQVIGWKTTPTTAGGTGLTSYTAGDLLYYATGTTLSKLAIGTAYYMLGVNAGATAPSWQPSSTSTLTTQGDLLYASAANPLSRLAKNTTATRYLSNTGASNNPAWAQIDLTNGVTGTLPIGNGGTGQTSFTANYIHYGSFSTSANLQFDGTNFSVGGAPSAFAGGYYGLQTKTFAMWSAGGAGGQLSTNLYYNGSNRIYISNGVATEYQQSGGGHYWSTAASGTAGGTVSLTQLMQLAPSGGLSLGNATDPGAGNLNVNGIAKIGGTTQASNGYASARLTIPDTNGTAGIMTAAGTTANLAQNATADVYTFPSGYAGVALITVSGGSANTAWRASAICWCSSVAITVYTITNSNVTVTGNGTSIRLTNTSASSNTLDWAVLRLS
jgi:hypothetical protein